jgi:biotin carboxyl carrier protein
MEADWPEGGSPTVMEFKAIIGERTVNGTVDRASEHVFHATVDGRSYELQVIPTEAGMYWIKFEDRAFDAVVVANADGYSVSLGEARFHIEIEDPRSALRRTAQRGHEGAAEIKAPMPGKVVRVLVEEGAAVQAKQGIVVMEAMKMQNEIRSPKAGIVKKVSVAVGSAVNSGDLLATVE